MCVLSTGEILRSRLTERRRKKKERGKVVTELSAFKSYSERGTAARRLLSPNRRGRKLNVAGSFISSPGTAGCEAACLNIYTQMQRRAHREIEALDAHLQSTNKLSIFHTSPPLSHCGTPAKQLFYFIFLFTLQATHLRDMLGFNLTVKTAAAPPAHRLSFCLHN